MNDQRIIGADVPFYLAHSFDEGKRFDIAHRAANLGDDDIVLAAFTKQKDVALDFIGDVRDDLYRFAKVFALSLFGDDIVIDAPGGNVVGLAGGYIQKALIVPQVQVGFSAIVGHVAFPMFIGVKGTRVYINIGVKLLDGYIEPPGLQ